LAKKESRQRKSFIARLPVSAELNFKRIPKIPIIKPDLLSFWQKKKVGKEKASLSDWQFLLKLFSTL